MAEKFIVLGKTEQSHDWFFVGITECESPLEAVDCLTKDGPSEEWSSLTHDEWVEHVNYWDSYKIMQVNATTYLEQ